jgi:hypothetical protein
MAEHKRFGDEAISEQGDIRVTHKVGSFTSRFPAAPPARLLLIGMATLGFLFSLTAAASAVTGPVDFFGGEGGRGGNFGNAAGVAVNQSGIGAGNPGDIYVTDSSYHRIERFARNDNGTPSDGSDDTYSFISAWGVGVEPSAGQGYEVCTVAEECREGIASGAAGGLSAPTGIAVDQDTGDVYVADSLNARVAVYEGDGTFLRAFGFDVVESGPDDNGSGYEVCAAAVDACKTGLVGSGVGQVGGPIPSGRGREMGIAVSQPDGNPASGTVFLADRHNNRVDTYHLDGSAPAAIGSSSVFRSVAEQPMQIAVDSRGILYASNGFGAHASVVRYDTENANGGGVGFLEPIFAPANEEDFLVLEETSGQYRLSFDPDEGGPKPAQVTSSLPLSHEQQSSSEQIKTALEALPAIGAGNIERVSASSIDGHPVYSIEFGGALARTNLPPLTVVDGPEPIFPSGSDYIDPGSSNDGVDGPLTPGREIVAFYVEPDLDGGGPDTDVFNVLLGGSIIDEFGPANQAGLSSPPPAPDAVLNAEGLGSSLASDEASGRLYTATVTSELGWGVYVLGTPGPGPSAALESLSDVTLTSVTAHATITPNGPPALKYHLEYSTDGVHWESAPQVTLGTQKSPQALSIALKPGGGFTPETTYHVRLVAKRPFFAAIVTPELSFTSPASPPLVETVGSPVRTTTSARLDGRVSPQRAATTYHFEYGEQGPCDSNPCTSTEPHAAGSGEEFELVSQQTEGLQPNTTYHYRVVADNGNPAGPQFGEDMTVTTRGEEAPLSHGHLPGPVGSDRAWEMVSAPDTSGNPVGTSFAPGAAAVSDAGDRAVYGVAGGTPLSENGNVSTRLFAERTASGWVTKQIYASRGEATSSVWRDPGGPSDLSTMVVENDNGGKTGEFSVWKLSPDGAPARLFRGDVVIRGEYEVFGLLLVSGDGSRSVISLRGPQDPAHPAEAGVNNLYDISSSQPQLVSLLPDGTLPACGIQQGTTSGAGIYSRADRGSHWVSADGSLLFFPSKGSNCSDSLHLYLRDLGAEETKLISTPPVSGPECDAHFIKSIPGAAYFYTQSRLEVKDTAPANCSGESGPGGDVYRYDVGDGTLDCLTCVIPGVEAGVTFTGNPFSIDQRIGVAEDGSRVYFTSSKRLLAGTPKKAGLYRLDVASGQLAYVGSFGFVGNFGNSTMNPNGSVVVFKSDDASLNALDGQQNGGTEQYYRYNDRDRSLVCASCPADGSAPRGPVSGPGVKRDGPGANSGSVSADGNILAFATPTPLTAADQNTAPAGQAANGGTDVYEWREGRILLISDGLINWPVGGEPEVSAITPSGKDIFFTEAAQLTPDALDGYKRLYDARIGGGFEFPPPPKPCPLEVCQGTPRGAPEEQAPGTATIAGAGNAAAHKAKAKKKHHKKRHKRHAKKTSAHKANNNRRASR